VFEQGRVYHRRTLQKEIGGQRYGGIATPAALPILLLVSGEEGREFGYRDEFLDDGTILYFGEGQEGDMTMDGGNRAVLDHGTAGEELHFFDKVRDGFIRYRGQYDCADFEFRHDVRDRNGSLRTAIVFHLVPHDQLDEESEDALEPPEPELLPDDLALLRALALEPPTEGLPPAEGRRRIWRRSRAVRKYVLRRAGGVCEGCDVAASFMRSDGEPYLEPHHTRRISDGGPDHPAHVIAVCPTCHRRAHHAADAEEFNADLILKLKQIETSTHS